MISGENVDSVRAVGNLGALREAVDRAGDPQPNGAVAVATRPATVGIGHTRWATHGRVSEANAHPHDSTDGRVHVVVNGIVENYMALKQRMTEQGSVFTSETDAEVIAHLIARNLDGDLPSAVRAAYAEIVKAVPEAEGVLVDRQVFPQAELIIGISRDAQFGPVVLAGSGGVLVEQLEDTALRLPPFDEDDALEMLAELHGRPAGDLSAVAGALVRMGLAALEWPQLVELDVNPLFVLPEGEGVLAGDALVVLT